MRRDGWITRERDATRWVYRLKACPAPRKRLSAQELIDRRRARDREKSRAKGVRPMAEWIAERARRMEARRHAKEAADEAERAKRAAAKASAAKPVHDRKAKPHVVVSLAPAAAPKKAPPFETVEQWMARTGKKPQVLKLGEVSKPLGLGEFNGRTRKAA
ncbi:MAG TPA: hypothetical protein VGD21_09145 [Lysobacter sp.]